MNILQKHLQNNLNFSLKPIHGPELPGDVKITKADIGLVQNMLNWKPETRIEKWLESTIKNGTNLDLLTE